MTVTSETHEAFASVIGDNAEFPLHWMNNHNFQLMVQSKRNHGVRGFPMYATTYEGAVYVWPINDGSAKLWWRPQTWRKPV